MNFPLPIRSFTSTTDFSTPLFVQTNIVYHIDETKFPGLHESSHSSEPALILDTDMSMNSCNTLTEQTETRDGDNQDLYNLIDSWVAGLQEAILSPVDLIDVILDLPDIRLELPKNDVPANERDQVVLPSVCDFPSFGNVYDRHLHNVIGEPQDTLYSNISIDQCDTTKSSTCDTCRFPATRRKKRNILSAIQENITNSNNIEDLGCSKRMKSESGAFNFSKYSSENCFESDFDNFFSGILKHTGDKETSMFHVGLNPINSLSYRQL